MSSTRTGIKGKAKIAGDWEGGYRLEWHMGRCLLPLLNQFNDNKTSKLAQQTSWFVGLRCTSPTSITAR